MTSADAAALPLPAPEMTNLTPPDAFEVELIGAAVVRALVADDEMLTEVQQVVMRAVFESMTGHRPTLRIDATADGTADSTVEGAVEGAVGDPLTVLHDRNLIFRTRIVQQMVLGALLVRPPSEAAVQRIAAASRRLQVDERMIDVAAELARGQLELAVVDFDRNGYTRDWDGSRAAVLHTVRPAGVPWQAEPADPSLAAAWASLEAMPEGSLGLAVSRFYRARGFHYPGTPGSVSPLLAQHDWVHVLADYGSTIDNELEVFAFIARANDDPRGFSFLAMVVSLFESGMLPSGAGLFEPDAGHLRSEGMATRLADAMRRGALCTGGIDFLGIDWFSIAHRQIHDLREEFGIVAKRAGLASPGPFEPGGISPYQWGVGQAAAAERGDEYATWGATVG